MDRDWVKSVESSLVAAEINSDVRAMVSELRSAGRSFAGELQSMFQALRSAQESIQRQASMPRLPAPPELPSNRQSSSACQEFPETSFRAGIDASGSRAAAPPMTLLPPEVLAPPPRIGAPTQQVLAPPPRTGAPSQQAPPLAGPHAHLQDFIAAAPAPAAPLETPPLSGFHGAQAALASFAYSGSDLAGLEQESFARLPRPRGLGRQPVQPSQPVRLQPPRATQSRHTAAKNALRPGLGQQLGSLDAKLRNLDAKFRQLGAPTSS